MNCSALSVGPDETNINVLYLMNWQREFLLNEKWKAASVAGRSHVNSLF
jgi:hypothetical protein